MLLNTGARTGDDDDDAERSDHTRRIEHILDDYDDDDDALKMKLLVTITHQCVE